jgi:hypothetical protein
MKKHLLYAVICVAIFFVNRNTVIGQSLAASPKEAVEMYGDVYLGEINGRLQKFEHDITSTISGFLKKIHRRNKALRKKIDAAADTLDHFQRAAEMLLNNASKPTTINATKIYMPYLDTVRTSLAFINNLREGIPLNNLIAANNMRLLELANDKLASIEKFKALLAGQKQWLSRLGDKYKKDAMKHLASLAKEYYYLGQKINTYKEILSDPSRVEEHMLAILRELPAFQAFLKENSILAGLFHIPAGDPSQLNGLQTREMVKAILTERTSFSSIDAKGIMAGHLQDAKSKMDQLKQKFGANNNMEDIPDFKSKSVRSKTFLQRVELGSDIKFSGSSHSLPVRSEVTLSAGYKFSDRISMGFGFTHRLGLGEGFRKIAFTQEGIGFSSYYRMQMKGNLFISGGWEQNYFNSFYTISNIPDRGWKSSALLGVGKKTAFGKSFLRGKWGHERTKSATITLLYDFLYKRAQPQTEALKVRFGFAF